MRDLVTRTAVALAVAGMTGCFFDPCEDTVKDEVPSPDGRYVATIYERDCGATTDYATHVAIRDAEELFDPDTQFRVVVMGGRKAVDAEWSSEDTLHIDLPDGKVFVKSEEWCDVRFVYE